MARQHLQTVKGDGLFRFDQVLAEHHNYVGEAGQRGQVSISRMHEDVARVAVADHGNHVVRFHFGHFDHRAAQVGHQLLDAGDKQRKLLREARILSLLLLGPLGLVLGVNGSPDIVATLFHADHVDRGELLKEGGQVALAECEQAEGGSLHQGSAVGGKDGVGVTRAVVGVHDKAPQIENRFWPMDCFQPRLYRHKPGRFDFHLILTFIWAKRRGRLRPLPPSAEVTQHLPTDPACPCSRSPKGRRGTCRFPPSCRDVPGWPRR